MTNHPQRRFSHVIFIFAALEIAFAITPACAAGARIIGSGGVSQIGSAFSRGAKSIGGSLSDETKRLEGAAGQGAEKVKDAAARIDPTTAIRQFQVDQAVALRQLRRLEPQEVLEQLREALQEQIRDEIARNHPAYDPRSGDLDLRATAMGHRLDGWLSRFATGNRADHRIDEFTYNIPNRRLSLHISVLHRHSVGNVLPGRGPMDLFSVTQHAAVHYDFRNGSGGYDIDTGRLGPRYTSAMAEKLSDGDILGALEVAGPRLGELAGRESKDEYDERIRGYIQRYGAGNVLFASKEMVNWAGPGTLGKYFANGVITGGVDVYQQIMRDFQRVIVENELPRLVAWLERKGLNDVERSALDLLSGRQHPWPFVKLEVTVVRYSVREHPAAGVATPWRHDNHLAYVVVWDDRVNRGEPNPGEVDGAIVDVGRLIDPEQDRLDDMHVSARARLRGNGPAPIESPKGGTPGEPVLLQDDGTRREFFAVNLGITYVPVPLSGGTYGARLIRDPEPGSPAAKGGLERGDIIIELDGSPIRGPNDVLNHVDQTTVRVIDVNTNTPQETTVFIPRSQQ
jgi:hypothetical protein